ncbi:hypothetical protein QF028_002392 [Neobacillus sp. B4I6]
MLCLFSVYLESKNAVYVYGSMFYEFKKTKYLIKYSNIIKVIIPKWPAGDLNRNQNKHPYHERFFQITMFFIFP